MIRGLLLKHKSLFSVTSMSRQRFQDLRYEFLRPHPNALKMRLSLMWKCFSETPTPEWREGDGRTPACSLLSVFVLSDNGPCLRAVSWVISNRPAQCPSPSFSLPPSSLMPLLQHSPAVHGFASDAKGSWIESQQGRLLSISTILNVIDTEVLIKIRIATSQWWCAARNIWAMKTHPYSQTVRYILALGFMGEQVIALEWTPR